MPETKLIELRQYRSTSMPLIRGELPIVYGGYSALGFFIFGFFLFGFSFIASLVIGEGFHFIGLLFSLMLGGCFIFWPLVKLAIVRFKTGIKPTEDFLLPYKDYYGWLNKWITRQGWVEIKEKDTPSLPLVNHLKAATGFLLWLGQSTGLLASLWHRAGMAANQQVSLNLEDACQNILVLGGIGSGKTTCLMQPLLLQCLDQGCGGLVFDIKGDVKDAVKRFAATTKRECITLGPKHTQINLLEGLTPEVAASFLKSAFLLSGKGHLDAFWVDTASELCRNTLGMLSFLPKRYSLQSLYQYLFSQGFRESINEEINVLIPTLDNQNQIRLLESYCSYHELIFAHFDSKIKSGVNATVAQALAPFNHPDLQDAFCTANGTALTKMEDILKGTVYLIDMPLSIWGLGGKVAYTFIKLRFFNLMQNRNQNLALNQDNPVFFMCDEYQEIVSANRDGLSDLNFWDKSRSSKTIGIISSQSIASFYAALGSHDLAHALLQNFRQKLCLRTEDPVTLDFINRLVGHARVKKVSYSYGNQHDTQTISDAREGVADAQLFRELKPEQAVAFLSVASHSMDDVLVLMPVY